MGMLGLQVYYYIWLLTWALGEGDSSLGSQACVANGTGDGPLQEEATLHLGWLSPPVVHLRLQPIGCYHLH